MGVRCRDAQRWDDRRLINIHGVGVKRALNSFWKLCISVALFDLQRRKRAASDLLSVNVHILIDPKWK